MYLPEDDAQLHDILAELRLYAQMNALPRMAEQIDDAIMVLTSEARRNAQRRSAAAFAEDAR
jgi:hypothetical protein